MDTVAPQVRSHVMAQVRSRGNQSTEVAFIQLMRWRRIKGWRRNSKLPGKPDFTFPKTRVVVFVDGCFWHGCLKHCRIPHTRRKYWLEKVGRNRKRDGAINRALHNSGWLVFRFWEHEITKECETEKFRRMKRMVQQAQKALREGMFI